MESTGVHFSLKLRIPHLISITWGGILPGNGVIKRIWIFIWIRIRVSLGLSLGNPNPKLNLMITVESTFL